MNILANTFCTKNPLTSSCLPLNLLKFLGMVTHVLKVRHQRLVGIATKLREQLTTNKANLTQIDNKLSNNKQ